MSTGDARRSQTAIALSFGSKQGESLNQQSNKKQREEIEDPDPAVIVSKVSTATITEETVNINPNLLSLFSTQTYHHNIDALDIKLDRLKEKSARCTLHKDFLFQCINSKLVPKGLEVTLEPTLGNYDQGFIDNWCSKLKYFCDKTIKETNTKIDQTEGILKQQLRKNE